MSESSFVMDLFNLIADCRKSTLEFETCASYEASGGAGPTVGLTMQGIKLHDTATGEAQWLTFVGAGGGVSVGFPIGGGFSTPDFPSRGSRLLKGPTSWGKLEFPDLIGAGHIYSFEAAIGPGVAGSLCFFNVISPPPLPPVLFKSAIWLEGISFGIPGAGVMGYIGAWGLW